ncbi:MAG TPA: nitrilase-related carbon-nitrogen hydrolase, partial [Saprospiraceae bacterium]|nr:nitrilase-related carbon-nitrogen hydrolase [Saprospiraceae bacterium]
MRITIVQSALHWEQPQANLAQFSKRMSGLSGQTDLLVLPEMFTTGFSMSASTLSEPMDGPTVDWLRKEAAQLGASVVGSFICRAGEQHFNRLVWAYPDGRIMTYDKRHLFGLAGEADHYLAGRERVVLEWRGWRICP